MTMYIIGALVYLCVLPAVVYGVHLLHKKLRITRPQQRAKKNVKVSLPTPLRTRYRELMKFARRDKREFAMKKLHLPVQNRIILWAIFGIGLILTTVGFGLSQFGLVFIGIIFYYLYLIFGMSTSYRAVKTINTMIDRMYGVARISLHYGPEENHLTSNNITITKWRDVMTPEEITFKLGEGLSRTGEAPFMEAFNLYFGGESTWVPSYRDGKNGWDYGKGRLDIYAVPPLPQQASFDAHYIEDPAVAWDTFPLGLTTENGIELENPKTKETEHVVAFSLSGLAIETARKAGATISETIQGAPQVLIAGRTGGGKAMAKDTKVLVLDD